MSWMDIYAPCGGRRNRSERDGERQPCCTWLQGGAVTLQGKDNISQLKQAEQSENVKTSSFPFVFAHKMTYFPI